MRIRKIITVLAVVGLLAAPTLASASMLCKSSNMQACCCEEASQVSPCGMECAEESSAQILSAVIPSGTSRFDRAPLNIAYAPLNVIPDYSRIGFKTTYLANSELSFHTPPERLYLLNSTLLL